MQPHDTDAPAGPEASGRRQFLKLGGGVALGAAFLAACGGGSTTLPGQTGTTVPGTGTTLAPPQGTTPEAGAAHDVEVARTLRSYELAAAAAYGVLLDPAPGSTAPDALALPAPLSYTDDVTAAFQLLQERHTAHAEALAQLVATVGGEPVTEPNRGVLDEIVQPHLSTVTTQRSAIQMAQSLEQVGASTATWAGGVLTTAALRQQVMAVGAASARQAAAVSLLLDPSGSAAVPGGSLDVSGPARLPAAVTLQEGQDGGDVSVEEPESDSGGSEDDGNGSEGDEG